MMGNETPAHPDVKVRAGNQRRFKSIAFSCISVRACACPNYWHFAKTAYLLRSFVGINSLLSRSGGRVVHIIICVEKRSFRERAFRNSAQQRLSTNTFLSAIRQSHFHKLESIARLSFCAIGFASSSILFRFLRMYAYALHIWIIIVIIIISSLAPVVVLCAQNSLYSLLRNRSARIVFPLIDQTACTDAPVHELCVIVCIAFARPSLRSFAFFLLCNPAPAAHSSSSSSNGGCILENAALYSLYVCSAAHSPAHIANGIIC